MKLGSIAQWSPTVYPEMCVENDHNRTPYSLTAEFVARHLRRSKLGLYFFFDNAGRMAASVKTREPPEEDWEFLI